VLGLEALVANGQQWAWLSRLHRFILSFGVVMAEVFFVTNKNRIIKDTEPST
jgi:hypothetical protein